MGTKQYEFVENLGKVPKPVYQTDPPNRSTKQVLQTGPPNRSPKQVHDMCPICFFFGPRNVSNFIFLEGVGGDMGTHTVYQKN